MIQMASEYATEALELLCNIHGCHIHWQLYLLNIVSFLCVLC
jgi:hypothetical protein